MKLENYEVHLPNYSIGDAIYDKIGPVCESYGKTVLVIGGKSGGRPDESGDYWKRTLWERLYLSDGRKASPDVGLSESRYGIWSRRGQSTGYDKMSVYHR